MASEEAKKQAKVQELNLDLVELQKLTGEATRQRTKDLLAIEIRKVQTEIATINAQTPIEPTTSTASTTSAANAANKAAAPIAVVNPRRYQCELSQYAFDQSDKFVKLFVTLDGVEKCTEDNVHAIFTESSITLTVCDLNNKDYQLKINNLLEPIDVAKSHRKIKQGMVIVYAKKTREGTKWSDLTLVEKRVRLSKAAALEPDKDLAAGGGDPTGGLMNIMQKMYNSGDAEMKKMISKAWTEGEEKRRSGNMDM